MSPQYPISNGGASKVMLDALHRSVGLDTPDAIHLNIRSDSYPRCNPSEAIHSNRCSPMKSNSKILNLQEIYKISRNRSNFKDPIPDQFALARQYCSLGNQNIPPGAERNILFPKTAGRGIPINQIDLRLKRPKLSLTQKAGQRARSQSDSKSKLQVLSKNKSMRRINSFKIDQNCIQPNPHTNRRKILLSKRKNNQLQL